MGPPTETDDFVDGFVMRMGPSFLPEIVETIFMQGKGKVQTTMAGPEGLGSGKQAIVMAPGNLKTMGMISIRMLFRFPGAKRYGKTVVFHSRNVDKRFPAPMKNLR